MYATSETEIEKNIADVEDNNQEEATFCLEERTDRTSDDESDWEVSDFKSTEESDESGDWEP